jgi:hypothetical protein
MKKTAKKPLALDIHTIRAISRLVDVAGGGTNDWRCDPTQTVSGNTNCCGSNIRNGCMV